MFLIVCMFHCWCAFAYTNIIYTPKRQSWLFFEAQCILLRTTSGLFGGRRFFLVRWLHQIFLSNLIYGRYGR